MRGRARVELQRFDFRVSAIPRERAGDFMRLFYFTCATAQHRPYPERRTRDGGRHEQQPSENAQHDRRHRALRVARFQ